MSPGPDPRAERIARNESRFREINERLERDLQALVGPDGAEPIAFVCECSLFDCRATLPLPLAVYEAIRRDPHRFAIAPGHDVPEVEFVVERAAQWWVIEKHPATHPLVEQTDPRRGEERAD